MASASKRDKEQSIIRNLDWFTLFIFVVLVAMGWMSVCGASYDFDQGTQLLDFSSRSGMQMVWILTSLVLGSVILCVDDRLVESLSYIIYIIRGQRYRFFFSFQNLSIYGEGLFCYVDVFSLFKSALAQAPFQGENDV